MSQNELSLYSSNLSVATSAGKGFVYNCTPVTITTTGTLSAANMLNRVIVTTGTGAITLTTDTAANIATALQVVSPNYSNALCIPANKVTIKPPIQSSFDFLLNNAATSSGAVTFAAGSGVTLVALSATVLVGTQRVCTVVIKTDYAANPVVPAVTIYC